MGTLHLISTSEEFAAAVRASMGPMWFFPRRDLDGVARDR